MMSIRDYLSADHQRCDDFFHHAELAASTGQWPACIKQMTAFQQALLHHLQLEEESLFPAFEAATGVQHGPTQVMRMEHQDMRGLVSDLLLSAQQQDMDGFLGLADTLQIMMQQHNLKEENVLYPAADRALAADAGELMATWSTRVCV
ncbi:hemerythrin domain-containing protein [Chitinivorax sp. B]|uniref:hemerythrin domain-containing protein n=1 Tax=Chitinivorax sp. B TaxID=2502235 RepID=UPI0010F5D4F1|nr:hemerythrin domain-containing protein [Chitinivorax sp. B]